MKRGELLSVIRGFLGRISSRNADWHGSWLWGYFAEEGLSITLDLLAPEIHAASPRLRRLAHLARPLLEAQYEKHKGRVGIDGADLRVQVIEPTTVRRFQEARPGYLIRIQLELLEGGRSAQDAVHIEAWPIAPFVQRPSSRPEKAWP